MAKVRLTAADEAAWTDSSDPEFASSYRVREAGDGSSPQLLELRYGPGAEIAAHRHDEHEIIYVVSGAMVVGARTVGPGGCMTVPGGTDYGFHAGPEGLHVLTFRAPPQGGSAP